MELLDMDYNDVDDVDQLINELRELDPIELQRIQQIVSHVSLENRIEREKDWRSMPWAQKAGLGYANPSVVTCEDMGAGVEYRKSWSVENTVTEDEWIVYDDVIKVDDLNRAKEFLMNNNGCIINTISNLNWKNPITLDCCTPSHTHSVSQAPIPCTGQVMSLSDCHPAWTDKAKEDNMFTETQEIRRHLVNRVNRVNSGKSVEIGKVTYQYPLLPKTVKELKGWLDTKNYTVQGEDKDRLYYGYEVVGALRFGPAFDEVKYNALRADLNKAFTEANDAIAVLDPKDGLKALQEFEAKVYN